MFEFELYRKKGQFSKTDSQALLMSMRSLANLGYSLPESLGMLSETEDNPDTQKLLKRGLDDILDNNTDPAQSLNNIGLIKGVEPFILRRSENIIEAIDNILDIRASKGLFESTLLKILAIPFIMVLVAFIIPIFVKQPLTEFVDRALDLVKTIRNVDIMPQMSPPFWYYDLTIVYIVLGVLLSGAIFIVGYYYYYLTNRPKVIYQSSLFKKKVYDDALVYFKLIASMREGGLSGKDIIKVLHDEERNLGWKRIFRELLHEISSTGDKKDTGIASVFKKNGFPKDITINIESAERGGDLWTVFRDLSVYAKDKSSQNAETLLARYKFMATMVGYMILLIMLGSVFGFGLEVLITMQTTMI